MSTPKELPLSLFDYALPEDRIAQTPVEPRDHSKLLCVYGRGRLGALEAGALELKDQLFKDVIHDLGPGDVIVMNNAKVLPVRLLGHRIDESGAKGGEVEALLLQPLGSDTIWTSIMHMSAKAKPGLRFVFEPGLFAECLSTHEERMSQEGEVRLRFFGPALEKSSLESWLVEYGHVPLPPYIARQDEKKDLKTYQTVYAEKIGSAAAPTAGFHFTHELIDKLKEQGVQFLSLTLHIGIGTFRPMKSESVSSHQMHTETYEVSRELAAALAEARMQGRRIVAVGTTVVRALESWWRDTQGQFTPGVYKTSLFITPGFQFQVVDDLFTNFHLPRSTLLVLVASALDCTDSSGVDRLHQVYQHALNANYRFFSYGDAMFIRGQRRVSRDS